MSYRSALFCFAVGLFALGSSRPVQAQVMLSNIPGSGQYSSVTILGDPDSDTSNRSWKAIGIETGSSPLEILSVRGLFSNAQSRPLNVFGGIFTDLNNNPGIQIAQLGPTPIPANQNLVSRTLLASGATFLAPNTRYWIALTAEENQGSFAIGWLLDSASTTPTDPTGNLTYSGGRLSLTDRTSWNTSTSPNQIEVNAVVAPEPASAVLGLAPLGLLAAVRARRRRGNFRD